MDLEPTQGLCKIKQVQIPTGIGVEIPKALLLAWELLVTDDGWDLESQCSFRDGFY